MAKYQNLSTLEEWVYKAGQAVYVSARWQEMESASEWPLAAAVVANGAYRAIRGGVVQRRAVRLPQEGWPARCMFVWNDLLRDRGRMISFRLCRHLSSCTFRVPWRLRSLQRSLFSSLNQYLGEAPTVETMLYESKMKGSVLFRDFWIHTQILSSLMTALYFMSLVYWFTPHWNISRNEIHHGGILKTNA